ncbi:replication protein A 70 kDa DNA-binding subunit C-like [Panicum miliaceum]|uniref:Replication protein A 70 kDa DNA-binding subunit C-like n=1 Tax=Panicum miliaceum TaxID=4540 RepID=A0A3L6T3A3_PANMI|nr:replication protein A 70 kDa DNA-binding subunit C-like [Panicum miliaceum]
MAERLKQWYVSGGKTAPCVSLSQDISSISRIYVQKTIAQIKDENLGRSDKPDLITVSAVISHVVADNFCYPACTLEFNGKRCNKKRYLLICEIMDHTGTTFATAFHEAGEAIVGYTAHELFVIRNVDQDELDAWDVGHHLLKEIDNRLKDVSCSAPEDASSYNPKVGAAGLGAGQGMQTSSHAFGYTTGAGGAGPVCQ